MFPSQVDEMPWDDFLELVAYNSVSPIGDERADIIAAQSTMVLGNLVRGAMGARGGDLTIEKLTPFSFSRPSPSDAIETPLSAEHEMQSVDAVLFGIASRKGLPIVKQPA